MSDDPRTADMGSATSAAGDREADEGTRSSARSPIQRSPSATPRGPYSLQCRSVPPTTASTLRRRRRKRTGLIDTPSRKTQRGSSDIDPSYSTDEEYHATESTPGARMLDVDETECSAKAGTDAFVGDSNTSDDAEASDIHRDSLVSNESPGKVIFCQCQAIASGAPTTIGGLHFQGLEDEICDEDVFVCAASGPGNFDRTPKSLEQAKHKLQKMVLTETPSPSPTVAPIKPSNPPDLPLARTISPGPRTLKAVSKAERLKAPTFDVHAPFDPTGDAVKKCRQLIDYARDTSEMMHTSSGGFTAPNRSLSLRASPSQRPMTGPVAPLTLNRISREQTKRDSVVTPKAKGKATPALTSARQRRQASPHQLSPTANRRLSSDDLFPDIYKSPVLDSPYRSPTVAEPGSLRNVLLDGAKRNTPEGEGIEVHDFAAGERDVEGLSEVDRRRTSTSTQSTPSKRSLGIQLKSGGWSIRTSKSSPVVETSSVDAGLVNASMSRLYDVGSPVSTTSMRSSYSGQSATMKENAALAEETEAMLPAKLKVKRRKRSTPHFALG
nr:hypothetical protein B0A51_00494 [Rachicladosporium sp. CCFEE 5018]